MNNAPTPRRALPSDETVKPRSGGKAWIVVVVCFAVLLAGGAAAYVTGILDPLIVKLPFVSGQSTGEPTDEVVKGEWPLTGVVSEINTRPAVVMEMENSPDNRPLRGLEAADLVVEEAAGENTTRVCAVFHSQMPEQVSSLGTLTATNDPMWPMGFVVLRGDQSPADYEPDPEAPSPTPFASFDTAGLGSTAQRQGEMASRVAITLPGGAKPTWVWDGDQLRWLRVEGEEPTITTVGTQLSTANVIILEIETGTGSPDSLPRSNLVGEGKGVVASGQMAVEMIWKRDSQASMWQFFDMDGDPVVLASGPTWIQIIPAGKGTWSLG